MLVKIFSHVFSFYCLREGISLFTWNSHWKHFNYMSMHTYIFDFNTIRLVIGTYGNPDGTVQRASLLLASFFKACGIQGAGGEKATNRLIHLWQLQEGSARQGMSSLAKWLKCHGDDPVISDWTWGLFHKRKLMPGSVKLVQGLWLGRCQGQTFFN